MSDTALNAMEGLLLLALEKGSYLRFPERFDAKPDIADGVAYYCEKLDQEGVPFSAQNTALAFINDVDLQPVWEELFKQSCRDIARSILNKTLS